MDRFFQKFSGYVHIGTKNRRLDFGDEPDHQDPQLFQSIFVVLHIRDVGGVRLWLRHALSECSFSDYFIFEIN